MATFGHEKSVLDFTQDASSWIRKEQEKGNANG